MPTQLYDKEIYTLVIPIKPEEDQPNGYYPGRDVGDLDVHKKHLNDHGGVFWSWKLKTAGIKEKHKNYFDTLIQNLGKFYDIDGKMVKINDCGFFYCSKNKAIRWKFKASTLKSSLPKENESHFIPEARKIHVGKNSNVSWLLISELDELDEIVIGRRLSNAYEFPGLHYYSNPKKEIMKFNTNLLTNGNAFLIEECF